LRNNTNNRWWRETAGQEEVKIRLRRGAWEVEVTCRPDQVQQVVESVLAGFAIRGAEIPVERQRVEGRSATCRSLVEELWLEGWFGDARTLGEVHEELARRGYNYDRTAVSHTLTDLVRENILTRMGRPRNYRYIQKRPPPGD
jgi:hypothetical protein